MRLSPAQLPKHFLEYGDNKRRIEEAMRQTCQYRYARQDADVERSAVNASNAAAQGEKPHPRYIVEVVHIRKRLADHGNLNAKYAIDAIVDAGLLPGDSPQYVEERHSQIKAEHGTNEVTLINIYEET